MTSVPTSFAPVPCNGLPNPMTMEVRDALRMDVSRLDFCSGFGSHLVISSRNGFQKILSDGSGDLLRAIH